MIPSVPSVSPQDQYDALEDEQERMETDDGEQEELSKHEQRCIAGINRLQGALQRLDRMTEIEKDMRSDHWQKLEKSNSDAVQEVIEFIKTIEENNVAEKADQLLVLIQAAEEGIDISLEGGRLEEKEKYEVFLLEMFTSWGLDDAEMMAYQAVNNEHNSLEMLHQSEYIEERIELFNALPKDIQKAVLGEGTFTILKVIAEQLASCDISSIPNGIFVSEEFEQKVHEELEKLLDEQRDLQKKLNEIQKEENWVAEIIAEEVKKGGKEEGDAQEIQRLIDRYEKLEKEEEIINGERGQLQEIVLRSDCALTRYEAGVQREYGNGEVADRMVLKLWERHGDSLRQPVVSFQNYSVEVGGDELLLRTKCNEDGTEEVVLWSPDSQYGVDPPRWQNLSDLHIDESGLYQQLSVSALSFLKNLREEDNDLARIQTKEGWKLTYTEYSKGSVKDPKLKDDINASYNRLLKQGKLSEEEKLLYTQKYEEALALAVRQQKGKAPDARVSKANDLLDQLIVRESFTIKTRKQERLFNDHEQVYNAEFTLFDGRKLDGILSEDAMEFMEKMRRNDKKPVLLCTNVATAKNGIGSLDGGIIRAKDLGALDMLGNMTDVNGKSIDVTILDDGIQKSVEWQTRRTAAFKVENIPEGVCLLEHGNTEDVRERRKIGSIRGQSGEFYEAIDITDVAWILNRKSPPGMTLILRHPLPGTSLKKEHHRGIWMVKGKLCKAKEEDFAYAKIDAGEVVLYDISAASKKEITESGRPPEYYVKDSDVQITESERVDVLFAVKEREEASSMVERVLDRDPNIAKTKSVAATIMQSMRSMQTMYAKGIESEFRQQNFVDFCKDQARPLLAVLNDPNTMRSCNATLSQLYELRKTRMGVASAGGDVELERQISALKRVVSILGKNSKGGLKFILREMLSAEKFDPQTWGKWFRDDLPALLISIAAAIIAAKLTGGVSLILMAASGAAGGLLGGEGGKDVSHVLRDWFDAGDVDDGGSMLHQYLDKNYKYNQKTGRYEHREFFADVATPLAKQFAQNFAMQLGAIFGGQILGKILYAMFSKCAWMRNLIPGIGKTDFLMARILVRASLLKESIVAFGNKLEKNIALSFIKEFFGEIVEETITEPSAQMILAQLNEELGMFNTVGLIAMQTFLSLRKRDRSCINIMHGEFVYNDATVVTEYLQENGYTVEVDADGALDVSIRGDQVMMVRHEADVYLEQNQESEEGGGGGGGGDEEGGYVEATLAGLPPVRDLAKLFGSTETYGMQESLPMEKKTVDIIQSAKESGVSMNYEFSPDRGASIRIRVRGRTNHIPVRVNGEIDPQWEHRLTWYLEQEMSRTQESPSYRDAYTALATKGARVKIEEIPGVIRWATVVKVDGDRVELLFDFEQSADGAMTRSQEVYDMNILAHRIVDFESVSIASPVQVPSINDLDNRAMYGDLSITEVLQILENDAHAEALFADHLIGKKVAERLDVPPNRQNDSASVRHALAEYLGLPELTGQQKRDILTAHFMKLSTKDNESAKDPERLLNIKKARFLKEVAGFDTEQISKLMGDKDAHGGGKREGLGLCGMNAPVLVQRSPTPRIRSRAEQQRSTPAAGTRLQISTSPDPELVGEWVHIKEDGDVITLRNLNDNKLKRISRQILVKSDIISSEPKYISITLDGRKYDNWFVTGRSSDGHHLLSDGEYTVMAEKGPFGDFREVRNRNMPQPSVPAVEVQNFADRQLRIGREPVMNVTVLDGNSKLGLNQCTVLRKRGDSYVIRTTSPDGSIIIIQVPGIHLRMPDSFLNNSKSNRVATNRRTPRPPPPPNPRNRERIQPVPQQRKPFVIGQEVYCILNNGAPERGWIISPGKGGKGFSLRSREPVIINGKMTRLMRSFDPDQIAHISEIETINERAGNMPLPKALEAVRRKYQMIEKHAKISKQSYEIMFGSELQQSNVGNCYLIAAFSSMKRSPHFEAIIRTSMQKTKPPDPVGYRVGFPLGSSQKTKWVFVSQADLQAQKVDSKNDKSGRTSLHPVQARLGWIVLEAAYIKLKTGNKTKINRSAIEGGFGHKALIEMFGKNAVQHEIGSFNEQSIDSNAKQSQQLFIWLDNYSSSKDIATVNSLKLSKNSKISDKNEYKVQSQYGEIHLYNNHAYSIRAVDKFNHRVVVNNPHDTSKSLYFTYEQFAAAFSHISGIEVDMNNIFR